MCIRTYSIIPSILTSTLRRTLKPVHWGYIPHQTPLLWSASTDHLLEIFSIFNQLESLLNINYNKSSNLIICGDFNINYLEENSRKHLLNSLLASFSLFSTVQFPTRIFNGSCTLVDNIYINMEKHEIMIHPLLNGLSDHDGQIFTLEHVTIPVPRPTPTFTRKIDSISISNFSFLLSFENWDDVFIEYDVNIIFLTTF